MENKVTYHQNCEPVKENRGFAMMEEKMGNAISELENEIEGLKKAYEPAIMKNVRLTEEEKKASEPTCALEGLVEKVLERLRSCSKAIRVMRENSAL
jgi:archaellum component FlaC